MRVRREDPRESRLRRKQPTQARLADKSLEVIFQGCLAKNRGSSPGEQKLCERHLRQIRGVMSMQGSLSIERMCYLARSAARFYRSLPNDAGGRRPGSAFGDTKDCGRTPAPLWLSKDYSELRRRGMQVQSQTRGGSCAKTTCSRCSHGPSS